MHDEIEDAEKKKGSQAGGCQRVNRLVDDQKPVCSQLFEMYRVFFLLVLPQKVLNDEDGNPYKKSECRN